MSELGDKERRFVEDRKRIGLERLRKLEAAATPPPWHWFGPGSDIEAVPVSIATCPYLLLGRERSGAWDKNAELIIEARNALPELLERCAEPEQIEAQLERTWSEIEVLEKLLAEAAEVLREFPKTDDSDLVGVLATIVDWYEDRAKPLLDKFGSFQAPL